MMTNLNRTFNTVNRPDMRIVFLLAGLCKQTRRKWCFPSQDWIVENLERLYGVTISRRTLNRHLRALADQGFIKRTRRHRRDKIIGSIFSSTLYTLCGAARRAINALTKSRRYISENTPVDNTFSRVSQMAQHRADSISDYKQGRDSRPIGHRSPLENQKGAAQLALIRAKIHA